MDAARSGPRRGGLLFACIVVVVVLGYQLQLVSAGVATGLPVDPDGWARLLRVREWWDTGEWYPALLPYLAAPEGLSLHWTRPLDLLILGGAWAGVHLLGAEPARAILLAGALVCPLLHAATVVTLGFAARRVWPDHPLAPYYALLAVLGHTAINGYAMVGRADHHALITGAGAMGLYWALRAAAGSAPMRHAVFAGIAFGFGVWVGPEVLLVAIPVLLGFGILWLFAADGAGAARHGLGTALGMAGVVALATPLERPPAEWLAPEFDKVSVYHLVMLLLIAAVFAGAMRMARLPPFTRALAGAAMGGAAGAALLLAFPGTLGGAFSWSDALPEIAEMMPVPVGDWRRAGESFTLVGIALAAVPAVLALLVARDRPDARPQAVLLLATLGVTLAATLLHRRFGVMLILPAAIAVAGLIGLVARLRLPPAAGALAALACLPLLMPGLVSLLPGAVPEAPAATADADDACGRAAFAQSLATAVAATGTPVAEAVIMSSDPNHGPALAWRTRLRFVAAPYHRGQAAVVDAAGFFGATDPAMAEAIARRRRVRFVLVCPGTIGPGDHVGARLVAGDAPAWLEPLPIQAEGVRLWRVRDDRGGRPG